MEKFPGTEKSPKGGEVKVGVREKENMERTFRAYMHDLHLTPEDLKKKILDVGSAEGYFSRYV